MTRPPVATNPLVGLTWRFGVGIRGEGVGLAFDDVGIAAQEIGSLVQLGFLTASPRLETHTVLDQSRRQGGGERIRAVRCRPSLLGANQLVIRIEPEDQ